MENKIKIFNDKKIRTIWNQDEEEWYFSVVDVVSALTDSDYQTGRKYWNKLSQRLRNEGSEVVTFCHRLKLSAPDGKKRDGLFGYKRDFKINSIDSFPQSRTV